MKNPDAVSDAYDEAAAESVNQIEGISDDERASLLEGRQAAIQDACTPWVEYSEYITVEIDTDAKTAIVLPVKR